MLMKLGENETSLPPVTTETAVTYASPKELLAAPPVKGSSESGVEGEFTSSDIKLPYLNLVQKMSKGELANFPWGTFVFDKSVKVGDTSQCVEVVVLRMRKQYVQVLDRDSQDMPQLFDKISEAKVAGLIEQNASNRKIKNGTTFTERCLFQLAVKAPKSVTDEDLLKFPYSINETHWGVALYIAQSTAYASVVRPVFTHTLKGQALHEGLYLGKFELHIAKEVNDKKDEYAVPKARFAGANTPEEAEFFRSIVGGA